RNGLKIIYLIPIIFIFLITGCSMHPDYSDVAQSIKDLCHKEFNISDSDMKVSIKGKTLYVYIKVDNLLIGNLQLSKEIIKKLEDILHSVRRVCISTNADMKFFKMVISDNKNPGIQFTITRYVNDILRISLGDISLGEYQKRVDINLEFNPTILGYSTLEFFFKDLESKNIGFIMKSYFPDNINLSNISPVIYTFLSELSNKKDRKIKIIEMKSDRIDSSRAVIYCKTEETYKLNELLGKTEQDYIFPSGFINEYLFVININNFPKIIEKILSFYTLDENNKLIRTGFPEEFSKYSDMTKWSNDLSGEIDESLDDFLVNQITTRIKNQFVEDKELKKLYKINGVQSALEKEGNKIGFSFAVDIVKGSSPEALLLFDNYYLDVLDETANIILYVLRRYEYKLDYVKIKYLPKNLEVMFTPETIKLYTKKKILMKDLVN
ncbi:hypothetical protein KKC59_04745, partial [bacterium]|nr:hypothetical protein [bacterium]